MEVCTRWHPLIPKVITWTWSRGVTDHWISKSSVSRRGRRGRRGRCGRSLDHSMWSITRSLDVVDHSITRCGRCGRSVDNLDHIEWSREPKAITWFTRLSRWRGSLIAGSASPLSVDVVEVSITRSLDVVVVVGRFVQVIDTSSDRHIERPTHRVIDTPIDHMVHQVE